MRRGQVARTARRPPAGRIPGPMGGMMAQAQTIDPATAGGLGATERRDAWWVGPLATGLGLGAFLIYATFRAIYNADYRFGEGTGVLPEHAYVLSPFFSPLLVFPWLPAWISPAFLDRK